MLNSDIVEKHNLAFTAQLIENSHGMIIVSYLRLTPYPLSGYTVSMACSVDDRRRADRHHEARQG